MKIVTTAFYSVVVVSLFDLNSSFLTLALLLLYSFFFAQKTWLPLLFSSHFSSVSFSGKFNQPFMYEPHPTHIGQHSTTTGKIFLVSSHATDRMPSWQQKPILKPGSWNQARANGDGIEIAKSLCWRMSTSAGLEFHSLCARHSLTCHVTRIKATDGYPWGSYYYVV